MSDKTILILESKTSPQMKLTPEIRASVLSLLEHPGYQYLMQRLALQRQFMRTTLEESPQLDLPTLARLQNGIYWTNWLESQIYKAAKTERPQPQARQLRSSEAELLEEIRKNIIPGEGKQDSATTP